MSDGAGGGGGAVVEVVVVVGGTVVDVVVALPACRRCKVRWNDAAAEVDVRDRGSAVWPKLAIWTATTAPIETSKIGTSPTARPRRAMGEGIDGSSWVWNVMGLNAAERQIPTPFDREEPWNRAFATDIETGPGGLNATGVQPL